MPEAVREDSMRYFEETVERVKGECLDPALAQHLEVGADFYRWFLFANRGDKLPGTLALRQQPQSMTVRSDLPQFAVAVHPDHPTAVYGSYGIIEKFTELAQDDLAEIFAEASRPSIFERVAADSRRQKQKEALVGVIKTSPVYGLLKSFEQQIPHTDERPLTSLEKQVQEAAIAQQIRRKHGLQHDEHIDFRSRADLELRKQVMQLDDETVRGKRVTSLSPAERARDYFTGKAREVYEGDGWALERVEQDDEGRPLLIVWGVDNDGNRTLYGENFFAYGHGIAGDVIAKIRNEMGSESAYSDLMDQDVLDRVLRGLSVKNDWGEMLDDTVQDVAAAHLSYVSFGSMAFRMRSSNGLEDVTNNLITAPAWCQILQPEGPIFSNDSYLYGQHTDFPNQGEVGPWHRTAPKIVSREKQHEQEKYIVGHAKRSEKAMADMTPRLVVIDGRLPELPLTANEYDLELSNDLGYHHNVLVPGYQLVAGNPDTNTYQFTKTETDPYQAPDLRISDAGRQRLIEYYESAGYTALLQDLRQTEEITVADLVGIIARSSDYTYDTALAETVPFGEVPTEKGRPQVQCTGAASLLQSSLRHALGGEVSSVAVLDGYVLNPGEDEINALRHRQVRIAVDGRSYLLDATPAGDRAIGPGLEFAARAGRQQRFLSRFKRHKGLAKLDKVPKKAALLPDDHSTESVRSQQTKTQPLHESAAAQQKAEAKSPSELRHRLEQQLMATFHVPNAEVLMKRLLEQSTDDPVRRTLSLAVQSTDKEGITTDIAALKKYVEGYERLTPQQRKQYRLPAYNANTLSVLGAYIDELSTTIVQ